MRVLYECDKRNFLDLLKKPVVRLFITGGATKKMMNDSQYYQIKHLMPAGGQVKVESKIIKLFLWQKAWILMNFFQFWREKMKN